MLRFISQLTQILTNNVILIFCITVSLSQASTLQNATISRAVLETPKGKQIEAFVLTTPQDKTKGLSGVLDSEFKDNQGALFLFESKGVRAFWMPNTYFNLDLFFLSKDLKIVDLERNVPHHPGYGDIKSIPRIRPVEAWHVLEMKSNSDLSKSLKRGDKLNWKASQSLEQIISNIHPLK